MVLRENDNMAFPGIQADLLDLDSGSFMHDITSAELAS